MSINRREWLQQSLLASAGLLVAGSTNVYGGTPGIKPKAEDGVLQLNWNENPYGPPESALKAVNDMMKFANRYPDEYILEIKDKLADRYNVKPANLLLTGGSTEVLSLLGQHIGLQNGEIVTGHPTFPVMATFGKRSGAKINKVALGANDRFDLEKMKSTISSRTKLVFICNPNNPTGTELPTDQLKAFCRSVPSGVLICVDEAYIEYSNAGLAGSMMSLVNELPNLLICRTFSKAYGLAGLRIGYAVSNEANITALKDRHLGFEMVTGWPPLAAANAALEDSAFIEMCLAKNEEGRQIVYKAFDNWGVKYNPTSTSFIYARHDRFDKRVVAKLEARGILITKWPDMHDHIRISIGKPDEMQTFVRVVEDFLI